MMRLVYIDTEIDDICLRCECGNIVDAVCDQFKELNDNYVIPKEDVELVCDKCGKAHTDSVIILEDQHPAQSKVNIPRCPTCQSQNIEKITTLDKAISFTMFDVFSRNLGKTFKCKSCGYRW